MTVPVAWVVTRGDEVTITPAAAAKPAAAEEEPEQPQETSLWSSEERVKAPTHADRAPVELGTRFTAAKDGAATGVRFYKAPGEKGQHTGSLWDARGRRLAKVTFPDETASGWQEARFSSPVQLEAGQVYTVSYHSAHGTYVGSQGAGSATSGPLSTTSRNAGVFRYGGSGGFPRQSNPKGYNYWVDVIFRWHEHRRPTTPRPTYTRWPTATPTPTWTRWPTEEPTSGPTNWPTGRPTHRPTHWPTGVPTNVPTDLPTELPTDPPTSEPSPTVTVTRTPTTRPTPTHRPTNWPTWKPTPRPTPTHWPTSEPTPTVEPTRSHTPLPTPTKSPTGTAEPTPTRTPEPTPTKTPTKSPEPTPEPTKPQEPGNRSCDGFPTPDCTGVPPGTKLTAKALNEGRSHRVTTAGTVLDGVHIAGDLLITANNVVVRNSQIDGMVINEFGPNTYSFKIYDSTVGPASGCNTLPGVGESKFTAERVLVRNHGDGFRASGDNIVIRDSFVRLCSNPGDHSDGIQTYKTGKGLVLDHNTIDQRNVKDITAPIFLTDPQIVDAVVTNNLVMGGTYSIQLKNARGTLIVQGNQIVDKSWAYGPVEADCDKISWKNNSIVTIDKNYNVTSVVKALPCAK
ncbi:DUF4082 domain-containing protein [Streptosporangium saharense]|uniref:DUF4082 domain-containing protein n=1 Tax=Streptosporangium saharense TaxID=1706840 RepID=UPI00344950FC